MRTTTRTGVMVPWARVPTNSVKRSFASGNDYGKKAKTKTVSTCDAHVTCTPTHACHACCIFAFKHTILCHTILFLHTVYNQDVHLGANWRLLSKCSVRRVGRGFRRLGAASELGLDDFVHCLPSHLFGYLAPAQSLLFNWDPLHRDRPVVFKGRSPRHVQPMRLCLEARVKVVYQPRCVVQRRETKRVTFQSCEKRERGQTRAVLALVNVAVIETGCRGRMRASFFVSERLGKERFERGVVRAWVDVAHENEAIQWIE